MNRGEEKHPAAPQAASKDITLRVADVLGRIPPKFLKPGPHDTRCEMRFSIAEVSEKIARGRASLLLSRIAELCPQIFRSAIVPEDDMEIALPLQKLVEQLGSFAIPPVVRKPVPPVQKPVPVEPKPVQPQPASAVSTTSFPPVTSSPSGQEPPLKAAESVIPPKSPVPAPPVQPVTAEAAATPAAYAQETAAEHTAKSAEPVEPTISLALAPIFRLLPSSVARYAPMPDAASRIALPMRLIEPQLAGGHVEILLDDFLAALPENVRLFLMRAPDVKVWIPLDEIFQNLPEDHKYHIGSELNAANTVSSTAAGESPHIEQPHEMQADEPRKGAGSPVPVENGGQERSQITTALATEAAPLDKKVEAIPETQPTPWNGIIRPLNIPPPRLFNNNQAGGQTAKG